MKTLFSAAAAVTLLGSGAAFAQAMSAQDFVNQAAAGGMFEVQSSELALEQAQNADVQAFAEMMIEDHTAANEQLASIATEQGLEVPSEIMGPPAEHLEAVQGAEGEEFDATYIEHQVVAHESTIELFETYAEEGDVEPLVTFAESTLPTLQEHHEQAQQLTSE